MASQHGGMDIEEVAHSTPDEIFKEYIDPGIGFQPLPGTQAGLQTRPRQRADRRRRAVQRRWASIKPSSTPTRR